MTIETKEERLQRSLMDENCKDEVRTSPRRVYPQADEPDTDPDTNTVTDIKYNQINIKMWKTIIVNGGNYELLCRRF